jgi:hypothetical protein
MYSVDDLDTVVPLRSIPQSDVGAPLPVVVSNEYMLLLAYLVSEPDPNWGGSYVTEVSLTTGGIPVALVHFRQALAHMFGPPNDEAFGGHPLAGRGLRPYGAFEVKESSWIRRLERMNSIHPAHRPEHFTQYHHYIFAFHDSTFECIAESFDVTVERGSIDAMAKRMVERLRGI